MSLMKIGVMKMVKIVFVFSDISLQKVAPKNKFPNVWQKKYMGKTLSKSNIFIPLETCQNLDI